MLRKTLLGLFSSLLELFWRHELVCSVARDPILGNGHQDLR